MDKVLLIKIEAPSYSSIGMETAFKEYFKEVHSIDWQAIRFNYGLADLRQWILDKCFFCRPDLIFIQIQKPEILEVDFFKELSDFGAVVNYTEDVREDTSWYEEVAPHIALTLFTNIDDVEKLQAKGIKNVAYMPVSYNHVWYRPMAKTEKNYGDIIFIGNNYVGTALDFPGAQERQDMINFMKQEYGDRFQAYGMGQENQMLLPAQCVEAYNNCKIAITHSNFKRKNYCSDRNLNAMACGALVIHQDFQGRMAMFADAPHLFTWDGFEDLKYYCDWLLSMPNPREVSSSTPAYTMQYHSWYARVLDLKKMLSKNKKPIRIYEFD